MRKCWSAGKLRSSGERCTSTWMVSGRGGRCQLAVATKYETKYVICIRISSFYCFYVNTSTHSLIFLLNSYPLTAPGARTCGSRVASQTLTVQSRRIALPTLAPLDLVK